VIDNNIKVILILSYLS